VWEPIGRFGQRLQAVIPREIFDNLSVRKADFVAFVKRGNGVLIKPKRVINPEDALTPEEAKIIRGGEAHEQLARFISPSVPMPSLFRRRGLSLISLNQTGHAPVRNFGDPPLAVRLTEFRDLKIDALAADFHQPMSEKPTVRVRSRQPEMPARARHGDIRHAFQFQPQHLMNMSRDHVLDAITPGQLV
jgi:hypothetical protein